MYPNYYMVGQAVFIVLGLWWLKEMLARFPRDISELRGQADLTTKGIIFFFWILTVGVVVLLWKTIYGIVKPLLESLS